MNGPIDSPTTQETGVGSIHDGIDVELDDVGVENEEGGHR
jgi:hypothetical protein